MLSSCWTYTSIFFQNNLESFRENMIETSDDYPDQTWVDNSRAEPGDSEIQQLLLTPEEFVQHKDLSVLSREMPTAHWREILLECFDINDNAISRAEYDCNRERLPSVILRLLIDWHNNLSSPITKKELHKKLVCVVETGICDDSSWFKFLNPLSPEPQVKTRRRKNWKTYLKGEITQSIYWYIMFTACFIQLYYSDMDEQNMESAGKFLLHFTFGSSTGREHSIITAHFILIMNLIITTIFLTVIWLIVPRPKPFLPFYIFCGMLIIFHAVVVLTLGKTITSYIINIDAFFIAILYLMISHQDFESQGIPHMILNLLTWPAFGKVLGRFILSLLGNSIMKKTLTGTIYIGNITHVISTRYVRHPESVANENSILIIYPAIIVLIIILAARHQELNVNSFKMMFYFIIDNLILLTLMVMGTIWILCIIWAFLMVFYHSSFGNLDNTKWHDYHPPGATSWSTRYNYDTTELGYRDFIICDLKSLFVLNIYRLLERYSLSSKKDQRFIKWFSLVFVYFINAGILTYTLPMPSSIGNYQWQEWYKINLMYPFNCFSPFELPVPLFRGGHLPLIMALLVFPTLCILIYHINNRLKYSTSAHWLRIPLLSVHIFFRDCFVECKLKQPNKRSANIKPL